METVVGRPLADDCPLHKFQCGEDLIDQWAKKKALVGHSRFKARVMTFHAGEDPEPLGLYSLTLVLESEKEIRKTRDVTRWTRDGLFPALHLEYLGVCRKAQGQGLGTFMMMDVIAGFRQIAEKAGVPILTLRPLNPQLTPYYEKRNFICYGVSGGMMMSNETAIRLTDGGEP
ncbi:GNAT family N-acetyltransferase [Brevundimonas sp.]|uniref:GNAT family N-acetyltransferase n=1 Tax=Brevundimonas sp. TaxID=1871086 RepID=UPI001D7CCFF9|nr:GNAT family N-acetyltransferase [Brevundimonas sp.]MBA4001069.1 hypothetical protein [Brevundimonas sp.]